MLLQIITVYCACADFLDDYGLKDSKQAQMTTAEVMTTALVGAYLYSGHLEKSRVFLLQDKLIPTMLSTSRLNRRLHSISDLTWQAFFDWLAQGARAHAREFLVDSFPVEACHFVRARRSKLYTGPSYFGYCASKKQAFFGLKAHLITDKGGRPVQMLLTPGSYADIRVLQEMRLRLPVGAKLHGDKGYTDYKREDGLRDVAGIDLIVARKSNSKRPHTQAKAAQTQKTRKRIETTFSQIVKLFGRNIHAVTAAGFQLKVFASVLVYAILNAK